MLYNEGRVVGASAYEIYVKQALAENPNEDPLSEREWLASSLNHGLSMVLRVEPDEEPGPHYRDFPLPDDSSIAAAASVFGSVFFGDCEYDAEGWATKVIRYGHGIENDDDAHPETSDDATTYPAYDAHEFTDLEKSEFLQYMKVQDGIVVQPGIWTDNACKPPFADLHADLNGRAVVRLSLDDKVTTAFSIILTGFTHKSVISAIADVDDGSTQEVKPENGDFLGPAVYPWASKILFSYPPIAAYYLRKGLKSAYDNLRIDHDPDDIDTLFTASYLKPNLGVSIYGPSEPGGDIRIGAKVSEDANNFIKVEQEALADIDVDHEQVPATVITHGHVTAGDGIAFHNPTKPGEEILVSSKIGSANKFVKVEQTSKSDSIDASEQTTTLTPSEIKAALDSGITVIPPMTPGADVMIEAKVETTNSAFLDVEQVDGKTILKPGEIVGDDDGVLTVITEDGKVKLSIDISKLAQELAKSDAGIMKIIKQIISKSPGTAISGDSITGPNWATGNLNVYSDPSRSHSLKTHTNESNTDLWFK